MRQERMTIRLGVGLAALLTGGSVRSATSQDGASKPTVASQVLLTAEPGIQFAISPRGQHLAAVALRGSRQVLVHDGVDGPRFDEIHPVPGAGTTWDKVVWSDDGSRFAYSARVGQEYVVTVDGKEVHRAPLIAEMRAPSTPIHKLGFTPGGKHWYLLVYLTAATGSGQVQLVIDGQAGPVGSCCAEPLFSPDGERHAYVLERRSPAGERSSGLIIDGKLAPYLAGEPQFTGDGLHLFTKRQGPPRSGAVDVLADGQPFMRIPGGGVELHMAPVGPGVLATILAQGPSGVQTSFLTVGNKKVPGSECTDNAGLRVYLSADAKHWAVRCRTWVMADAKKGQEYAEGVSNVAFTADGRPVYQAMTNGKTFLIVGDQESDGYFNLRPVDLQIRPPRTTGVEVPPATIRGNKVGYIGQTGQVATNFAVVVDGKSYPAVNASLLTFSPDGSRFAFLAGHPYSSATVDGVNYGKLTVDPASGNIGYQGTFQWSADSKHVAWIVGNPPGVAIDGKFVASEGAPRFLKFTADGRHLVWLVRGAPGHRVFVDGIQVLELPQNLALENEADIYWSFGDGGTITFVAQDGDAMKRFTITPGRSTNVETLLAKATTPQ